MAYQLDEQETFIRYDKLEKAWYYETNIYGHIQRILKDPECYEELSREEENGRVISIQAKIRNLEDFRVNPWGKKRRKMSEEQKAKMAKHLKRNFS